MKELKMKDLVLEHYRKVYETQIDGVTVRVWKPKTMMRKLPTYAMLDQMKTRVEDAKYAHYVNSGDPSYKPKVRWATGNPDYAAWDAHIVRRFDPKKMELDLYFAALLIRPFSKQAYEWYEAHSQVYDPVARLILMWDSREFDERHGYDTSYGAYKNQKEIDKYLYSGKKMDFFEPVDDPNFDPVYVKEEEEPQGIVMKYRHKDGKIETETSWPLKKKLLEEVQQHLKPALQNFIDFTKEHPEVPEIHYYTDRTHWEADDEEETEKD